MQKQRSQRLVPGMTMKAVYRIAAESGLNWQTVYRAYGRPPSRIAVSSRELILRVARELGLPAPPPEASESAA